MDEAPEVCVGWMELKRVDTEMPPWAGGPWEGRELQAPRGLHPPGPQARFRPGKDKDRLCTCFCNSQQKAVSWFFRAGPLQPGLLEG